MVHVVEAVGPAACGRGTCGRAAGTRGGATWEQFGFVLVFVKLTKTPPFALVAVRVIAVPTRAVAGKAVSVNDAPKADPAERHSRRNAQMFRSLIGKSLKWGTL
jgi:hypothetical protein